MVLDYIWTRGLRSGAISTTEGPAGLRAKEVAELGTAYYIKIGRTRLQVPLAEQFGAFDEGARYRVYYIKNPPAHIILSAEKT